MMGRVQIASHARTSVLTATVKLTTAQNVKMESTDYPFQLVPARMVSMMMERAGFVKCVLINAKPATVEPTTVQCVPTVKHGFNHLSVFALMVFTMMVKMPTVKDALTDAQPVTTKQTTA